MRYVVQGMVMVNAQVIVEADDPEEAYDLAGMGIWEELEVYGPHTNFRPDEWPEGETEENEELPVVKLLK